MGSDASANALPRWERSKAVVGLHLLSVPGSEPVGWVSLSDRGHWKATTHQKHTYHRTLADARLAVERRLELPDCKGAE